MVDLVDGKIIIPAIMAKNKQSRYFYLPEPLIRLLGDLKANNGGTSPYVFTHNGKQIKDPRAAWRNACKAAGLGHKLFHDFRRTAVRNMIRNGVAMPVAQLVSGHKDARMFSRYNISSDDDLRKVALLGHKIDIPDDNQ